LAPYSSYLKLVEEEFQKNRFVQELILEQRHKLLLILLTIPQVDLYYNREKKIPHLLRKLPFSFWMKTLSSWSLHDRHAEKFGLTKRSFRKLLKNDATALPLVIEYITQWISLDKPIAHFFAEYNIQEMATAIAALQRALNACTAARIDEDGILGDETRRVLKKLSLEPPKNEMDVLRLVQVINRKHNLQIEPFIPHLSYKREFFRNNIDVQRYVAYACEIYFRFSSVFTRSTTDSLIQRSLCKSLRSDCCSRSDA
jgi:hypothetical protein